VCDEVFGAPNFWRKQTHELMKGFHPQ